MSLKSFAQTGIGTKSVNNGIELQIESKPSASSSYYGGFLVPRVALTSTDVFLPITGGRWNGLLVYNTATAGSGDTSVYPGFYFWELYEDKWIRIEQRKSGISAKFSNQDTTTDLNQSTNYLAPIFANVRFNKDPSLYQKISDTTLQINEAGFYKITLNLDLSSSGGADNFGVELLVNGQSNIISENIYIPGRWDTEGGAETYFPNGRSYTLYVPINVAGQRITMTTYELDPGTDVRFKTANTSTFSIEKIR
nr:hypothetical protein [uncultured Flavobacterium sp.]